VPRFLVTIFTFICLSLLLSEASAQGGPPGAGEPPVKSLISITAPDEQGRVTIIGAAGAVYPGAHLSVRNLYTEDVAYVQAGITGSFSVQIYGPGNTPFWISPGPEVPASQRNRPGALWGGPGTIIYGAFPRDVFQQPPIVQILLDGQLSDWEAYPQAALRMMGGQTVYGLHNQQSLYLAFGLDEAQAYEQVELLFTLENTTYTVTLDPRLEVQTALWRRIAPNEADLGTLAVSATQGPDGVEIRIPLSAFRLVIGTQLDLAVLQQISLLGPGAQPVATYLLETELPALDVQDGVVKEWIQTPVPRFTISGPVAQGAAIWHASARVNSLELNPGDDLRLQFNVNLNAPALPDTLVGVTMIGRLSLQPVVDGEGALRLGGLHTNNGISTALTPSGLPVDNLYQEIILGEAITPAPQVLRQESSLRFALDFDLTLPEDLPAGLYVPVLEGFGQIGDGERFRWEDNGIFGTGNGLSRVQLRRLPIVLKVGEVGPARLVWSLFHDTPSNGSRGILSTQAQADVALSNRVRLNSPTYILPPSHSQDPPLTYSVEPYLLNLLPNDYEGISAPLIPFLFPSGRLSGQITYPDGTIDGLNSVSLLQNRLSTATQDERRLFGGQSPLDVYQLTTLDPAYTQVEFNQYGEYQIQIQGSLEDVWGNAYSGGGQYSLLIAEPLQIEPGVLPGTPFEVGDYFNVGVRVLPGVAADVQVHLRLYPLDGSMPIEHMVEGQANASGYFHSTEGAFLFETDGEYVVDYEVRYTDTEGRLWAGSQRSAGLVATPESDLVVHGRRGLQGYSPGWRPAWFSTNSYRGDSPILSLQFPYHSGDVLWYTDAPQTRVNPALTVQDLRGDYAEWLIDYKVKEDPEEGLTFDRQAARGVLPVHQIWDEQGELLNDAYTYVTAVRPGVVMRQFVQGGTEGELALYWDPNDPYNQQVGAGPNGDQPGDYAFLFGGAVVRNEQAGLQDAAIYGSVAMVIDPREGGLGPRVYPPYSGEGGGADGGPLIVLNGQAKYMFFAPTGVKPGDVLTLGDTFSIAGQVAPTLASRVLVTVTDPDGETRHFDGLANAIGHYYHPAQDFVVDKVGVWTVDLTVQHEGLTSAGQVYPPYPQGGILGLPDQRFTVYVVDPATPALSWNDERQDIDIPGGFPFNFNFSLPTDWTDIQIDHLIRTPALVIETGPLPISGNSFSYQYNPTNLNRAFPQIEVDARLTGASSSDPLTMVFSVTGNDATGQRQVTTRTFTVFFDRLLTLE
jgi:hypothetical protein